MSEDIQAKLIEIHGYGECYICHRPRAGKGWGGCSYPHGMIPTAPVDPKHPGGFWSWEKPE